MIEHVKFQYGNCCVDPVHSEAERIGRQEVTAQWFWENGVDHDMTLYAWIYPGETFGLDPWCLIEFDQIKPSYRLFIRKKDLEKFYAV